MKVGHSIAHSILEIHSGMAKGVALRATAAGLTVHPGSVNSCLNRPLHDDIELKMCGYNPFHNEDTPLEIVEIYVQ